MNPLVNVQIVYEFYTKIEGITTKKTVSYGSKPIEHICDDLNMIS